MVGGNIWSEENGNGEDMKYVYVVSIFILLGTLLAIPASAQEKETTRGKDGPLGTLAGTWRSTTTHFYSDATSLRENGNVECTWILHDAFLQCERRYVSSDGKERQSLQLYSVNAANGQKITADEKEKISK